MNNPGGGVYQGEPDGLGVKMLYSYAGGVEAWSIGLNYGDGSLITCAEVKTNEPNIWRLFDMGFGRLGFQGHVFAGSVDEAIPIARRVLDSIKAGRIL